MKIEYDTLKNQRNIAERSIDFNSVKDFDFATAFFFIDKRKSYPEIRYIAVGYLKKRLHVLCFSKINNGIRVISFRKANAREGVKYEKLLTLD
ncbi:BrnT family toxin [Candidatus Fukatsuia symbiotica]|uniref:BrnT family toxin n=1 Tax=Candidatus Fukatsuia symbiotica TaxID=1878942 RepID=A0A2U8I8V9_9GAMM|nr:BrnT family toxin [Candidatus Fukatsuia symbiotica]AWK15616.1 hypothetical protein CCS41_14455 [Candidatus Fukatsuia symbiotica]MEA9446224.1 BrnT family toxin [Candidatus Fukatsuia symbiotica]